MLQGMLGPEFELSEGQNGHKQWHTHLKSISKKVIPLIPLSHPLLSLLLPFPRHHPLPQPALGWASTNPLQGRRCSRNRTRVSVKTLYNEPRFFKTFFERCLHKNGCWGRTTLFKNGRICHCGQVRASPRQLPQIALANESKLASNDI